MNASPGRTSTTGRSAALGALLFGPALLLAPPAQAQPFDAGPPGIVTGSSMAGARIGGAPRVSRSVTIPGADVFGDTVEERVYGRAYDDSFLRPRVRRGAADEPIELRATEGRADLNGVNAGAFARGEADIGTSAVTRPSLGGRGGRARIRR